MIPKFALAPRIAQKSSVLFVADASNSTPDAVTIRAEINATDV